MSDHSSKSLEGMKTHDGNQDSNKIYSHSTPNLKRKVSDTHSDKSNGKNSNIDLKRRKKDVPSCSKSKDSDLKQFIQEELTCSICSELFIDAVTLNCSHSFCECCISKWMKEQSTCPVCRKEISSRNSCLVLDRFVEKILEHLPEESKNHRRTLIELRQNEKGCVPPIPDPADPDTEQLINDFLCWFGITEFMEAFDVRNQEEEPTNYNHNDNCTIN